jgi:L-rhamnonate dehydratase
VRIAAVRLVEYRGTIDHEGAFWEERLIRPVDIYPQFRAQGPGFLPGTAGDGNRVTSAFVHIETDEGVTGTAGPITRQQAYLIGTDLG